MPVETFRARAHILKLLGDELIGNEQLAVFELVKNSYDGDANNVTVTLDLDRNDPAIIVRDDGVGMSLETLRTGWFEIGSALKRGGNRKPSKKYQRMPLGEKGVGRLAAHKLGNLIKITTRARSKPEIQFTLNWNELTSDDAFLDNRKIQVRINDEPRIFKGRETGTRIRITQLRRQEWKRGEARALKRMITSLVSPFAAPDSFNVSLLVPAHEDWLKDLFDLENLLDSSIWHFGFSIDSKGYFKWSYDFRPPTAFRSLRKAARHIDSDDEANKLGLLPDPPRKKKKIFLNSGDLKGIGPIFGEFFVYDRRPKVLSHIGQTQQLSEFLDEQTGVRVYRDGVRVFNYGERWDDWLGLNADRVNRPAKKMGTNSVIAAIHLTLSQSQSLHEKTNREGFDENDTYQQFKRIIRSVVNFLDRKRRPDRETLDKAVQGNKSEISEDSENFDRNIDLLRKDIIKHGLEKQLGGRVDSIEKGYTEMREVLMASGMAGLNLALVFHEIERGIKTIRKVISNRDSFDKIEQLTLHLSELLEGFAPLLKKSEMGTVSISALMRRSLVILGDRFGKHKISFSCPVLVGDDPDFEVKGAIGLYLSSIINLIDNSIYWVRYQRERNDGKGYSAIAVRTFPDWATEGPSIVVADSGPGFGIEPSEAIRPFVSDRAGGMGLGLYFANLVMESQGGELIVVDRRDLELPKHLTGAAVVLRFRRIP